MTMLELQETLLSSFSFLSFLEGGVGVVKYGNGNNVAVKNKEAQWIWWKPDDCFK